MHDDTSSYCDYTSPKQVSPTFCSKIHNMYIHNVLHMLKNNIRLCKHTKKPACGCGCWEGTYWEQWPNKAKYQTVNNLPVKCLLMKNTEMQQQQLSLSAWLPSLCPSPLSLPVSLCPHRSLSPSPLSFFLTPPPPPPRLVSVSRIRLGELCRRGNCQKYSVWSLRRSVCGSEWPPASPHTYRTWGSRGVEGTPVWVWALTHEGMRRGTGCFCRGKGHYKALHLKRSWYQIFFNFRDWN